MNVITACVPSARLCPAISAAFARQGLNAEARSDAVPGDSACITLPCPIEPVEKHHIWFVIQDGMSIEEFLDRTFFNVAFVTELLPSATHEDDAMALECLVAGAAARSVEQAFFNKTAPSKLYRVARAEGKKPQRRLIAEKMVGVPDLPGLLVEFAESLVAGPHQHRQLSC